MTFPKLQAAIDVLTLIANGHADTEDRKPMIIAASDLRDAFPSAAAYLEAFAHGTTQDTTGANVHLQGIAERTRYGGFMLAADAVTLIDAERQRTGRGLLETMQDLDYRIRDNGRTSDPVSVDLRVAFNITMDGMRRLFAPI